MTTVSLWYRGVRLQRHGEGSGYFPGSFGPPWSGLWLVEDKLRSWNDSLAWLDAELGYVPLEKHHIHALPPHYCKDCGERDLLSWDAATRERLQATGLCFSCLHWADFLRDMERGPRRMFISGGVAYSIGDQYKGDGHGGRRFHVVWPDGQLSDTRNLWCAGEVDEHWRPK